MRSAKMVEHFSRWSTRGGNLREIPTIVTSQLCVQSWPFQFSSGTVCRELPTTHCRLVVRACASSKSAVVPWSRTLVTLSLSTGLNCTLSWIKDLQNAEKLRWRANLHFSSLVLCIFWLHVPHGSDNAPIMAAAAVVSMGE